MRNSNKSSWTASCAFLISAALVGTSIAPQPAHAVIGLVTGIIPLTVIGGGLTVGVPGAILFDEADAEGNGGGSIFDGLPDWTDRVVSLAWIGGIVLLDAKGQVAPTYSSVTPDQAAHLGMTRSEQEVYNAPETLDEINTISQNILAQSVKLSHASPKMDLSSFIRMSWKNAGSALSPDAFSGLLKVQYGIASALQTKK